MDLNKTIEKINKDREKFEACFVFSCWEDPELFDTYKEINVGKDKTLINKDAQFYWSLGYQMYKQGIRKIDAITLETFLSDKSDIKKKYDKYGGFQTVKELQDLIDPENVEAYYDRIIRMNSLTVMAKKTEELFTHVERFDNVTNDDVYNAFDLLNDSVALSVGHESKIENLIVTQDYVDRCKDGENMGISYAQNAPLLNYTTLGLPVSDVYLLAAHSGSGKTSWAFENMVIPISEKEPVAVISNEMKIEAYQNMLLIHILTKDLNYWDLTRKKIKIGKYTDKDEEMISKAIEISKTKYNIKFVKIFENDTSLILKHIRRLSNTGVRVIIYDTMKGDDVVNTDAWLQLLMNSRKIFNLTSKLGIALVCTFQLALYTTNQRFLDASCLSSSKQIKEVVSELIMMRKLWDDEYTGEKYDCHPYKFNKDNKKIRETVDLDKDKNYYVFFINKTRNDEGDRQILFEWQGHYNKWKEIGYCTIRNDHKGSG